MREGSRRHEVLRTVIGEEGGVASQRVLGWEEMADGLPGREGGGGGERQFG